MTSLLIPRTRSRPSNPAGGTQQILLCDVDWQAYRTICDALIERPIRLTYDQGELEIMVVSAAHDRFKTLIGVILFVLAETLHKEIRGFGGFTHRREDLARGLEPDQCYYVVNAAAVEGKLEIDLTTDPPPDLSIEIEVSRSLLDRLAILAALCVPEVWRVTASSVQVLVLRNGQYESNARSLAFPEIDVTKLVRFLRLGAAKGEMTMARELRAWLKKQMKSKRR